MCHPVLFYNFGAYPVMIVSKQQIMCVEEGHLMLYILCPFVPILFRHIINYVIHRFNYCILCYLLSVPIKYFKSLLIFLFDFIECFTTTFLRAHSWLNWVDEDDDEDEVGLKEKPEDTRYIKKITSK